MPDTSSTSVQQALDIYQKVRKSRAETLVDMATANGKAMHLGEGKAREERDALFRKMMKGEKGPVPDKWADKDVQKNIYGFDCILETQKACSAIGW